MTREEYLAKVEEDYLKRMAAKEIKSYPVSPEEYSKEEAPYLYTAAAEAIAAARHLEPRTAGTVACFGGKLLPHCDIATSWLKAGYIVERL